LAAAVYLIARTVLRSTSDLTAVSIGLATGILLSAGIATYQVATSAGPESFDTRGVLRAYEIGRAPSELQSQSNLVCRLLLEKKNQSLQPHFPTFIRFHPWSYLRPLSARSHTVHPP